MLKSHVLRFQPALDLLVNFIHLVPGQNVLALEVLLVFCHDIVRDAECVGVAIVRSHREQGEIPHLFHIDAAAAILVDDRIDFLKALLGQGHSHKLVHVDEVQE